MGGFSGTVLWNAMVWTTAHIALLVGGAVVCVFGFWLFKLLGRWADQGRQWLKGEWMKNVIVLGMLSTWTAGIVLIGYGLGLGGRLQ
jgi:hypothetical protein